jgi:hypothetical protein
MATIKFEFVDDPSELGTGQELELAVAGIKPIIEEGETDEKPGGAIYTHYGDELKLVVIFAPFAVIHSTNDDYNNYHDYYNFKKYRQQYDLLYITETTLERAENATDNIWDSLLPLSVMPIEESTSEQFESASDTWNITFKSKEPVSL